MLFHSINFLFFFTIIFSLHWFLFSQSMKKQNFILVLASYFFYASWDYRFLLLLLLSTLIDFITGIKIFEAKTSFNKKIWLTISMVLNIGILVFFKYFNFIADNLMFLFQSIGSLSNTIQYNTIQYNTIQYNTIQYNTTNN